jgi:hypothetical protein
MIVAIIGLTVTSLVLLAALMVFSVRWEEERQILLERIQAPERVRVTERPAEDKEPLELDDPELARVGTIDYGEPDA